MAIIITPSNGYRGILSKKIDRNAPCGCGSGRKAKKCCGTDTKYYNRDVLTGQIEEKKEQGQDQKDVKE